MAAYSGFEPEDGHEGELRGISSLRKHSSAWKLLRADNAPLILSFFGKVFVEEDVRSISSMDLVSRLDDELYALNERLGEAGFPKPAKAYLDDWAAPEACGSASITRRSRTSRISTRLRRSRRRCLGSSHSRPAPSSAPSHG